MVRQLRARDFVGPPGWVRKFVLASVAILYVAAIVFGGTLLARGGPAAVVPQGAAFICAGAGALIAVYRDWRYRQPFNESPLFVGAIVLVVAAQLVAVMW